MNTQVGMAEQTLVYGNKSVHVRLFHVNDTWYAALVWTGQFTPAEEDRILHAVPGVIRTRDGRSFVVTLPVDNQGHLQNIIETFTDALGISAQPQGYSYRTIEKRVMASTPDWARLIDAEMRKPKMLTMGGRRRKRSVSVKRRRSRTPRRKCATKK